MSNFFFFFLDKQHKTISVSSLHPHTPQEEKREFFPSQPGTVTDKVAVRGCLALADAGCKA